MSPAGHPDGGEILGTGSRVLKVAHWQRGQLYHGMGLRESDVRNVWRMGDVASLWDECRRQHDAGAAP